MSMLIALSKNRRLRRIVLPIFARVNAGDVTITHHWTGDPLKLHSFRHKGYWFQGRGRERAVMLSLIRLVGARDVVYDVGGHIGYTGLLFASLAGQVHVFEPGSNNLPYLRVNVGSKENVVIVQSAAGLAAGTVPMLIEDLSGQNNTLLPTAESFRSSTSNAFVRAKSRWEHVPVTTLDDYSRDKTPPDLIKIDVEGYEFEVLQGALRVLRDQQPALMVEVSRHQDQIAALMTSLGYGVFRDDLADLGQTISTGPNVFFLHRDNHRSLIERYSRRTRVPTA